MNKYEKLIEHIINDEDAKARALFHEIVVEKSRDIYESLMDQEMDENIGGNHVDGMMDEIQADESGLPEDEEMGMDMGDEHIDGDDGMDDMGMDDMGGDDMGGEGSLEDKVMDLESELEALKAEFEQLMGDEANEPEHHDGMDDPDFGGADDEEGMMESAKDDEEDDEEEDVTESVEDDDEEEDDEEETNESRNYRGSEVDLMREYVEKVSMQYPNAGSEGQLVGTGKNGNKPSINKKSITDNMKNDMGGTTANIVKGGSEEAPDGKQYKGPSNAYTKGQGEVPVAKRNVNKPGGNKGAQNWYGNKETSYESNKGAEGQTTDGKVSVDNNSILKHIK